jgi:flavin-dependent thymidylate synthase
VSSPMLEVRLAGHNLDRDLLDEIRAVLASAAALPPGGEGPARDSVCNQAQVLISRDNWTPETLSAAYARISRDARPVGELRAAAREEVDQARKSNETIIFGFGHHSVAEHAVFNLDILGLSRLAAEEIERMRLCSYTEKSQRYILLDEDFVVPEEVRAAGFEDEFRAMVGRQNAFYREAYDKLLPWIQEQNPALAAEKKNRRTLEGWAKEDARYGLSLATTVQLGETLNARNCEALIARTAAHGLAELRDFSSRLHKAVVGVTPSLLLFTGPREAPVRMREEIREAIGVVTGDSGPASATQDGSLTSLDQPVVLTAVQDDAEIAVVTALLHTHGSGLDAMTCRRMAADMGSDGRDTLLRATLRRLGPHDPPPREFEYAAFQFEIVLSAACFGQLKRHRMATLTLQAYDPSLGVTIPPSFEPTGLAEPFSMLRRETEGLYNRMVLRLKREAAAYILLNAHRRRILWGLNAREIYHVARLRLDSHAQWDIRRISERVLRLSSSRFPSLFLMACGKDAFEERRREVFGGAA